MAKSGKHRGSMRGRRSISYSSRSNARGSESMAAQKAERFLNSLFGSAETMYARIGGARTPLSHHLGTLSPQERKNFFLSLHKRFLKRFGRPRLQITDKNVQEVLSDVQEIVDDQLARSKEEH